MYVIITLFIEQKRHNKNKTNTDHYFINKVDISVKKLSIELCTQEVQNISSDLYQ